MKELSIICSIIFVFGMIGSSVLAQDCSIDTNCIATDLCTAGTCDTTTWKCTYSPVTCDDSDLCTTDTCDPSIGCQNIAIICDDGDLCTTDTCDPSIGCQNTPIICEDDNLTTTDTCDPVTGECTYIPMVSVDIKPGSCQNPLNVRSRGVLTVVIHGSETFDVMSIDPASIGLGREGVEVVVAPIRWRYEDVGTLPLNGELCACDDLAEEDVNEDEPVGDGYADLKLKFSVPALVEGLDLAGIGLGKVKPREIILLTIMGTTADGTSIMGQDCVQIINNFKLWSGPKGPNGPEEPNSPKEPKGPKEPKEPKEPKGPKGPKRG